MLPSETPANQLTGRRGLIISGGPSSVYDDASPTVDPAIFESTETSVLGICYGMQLMAHLLGGSVKKGDKGEYGLASFVASKPYPLFRGIANSTQRIWMNHRDLVDKEPEGFTVHGSTGTCPIAAMSSGKLHAVQFHPEVVHTEYGNQILANFVFDVCGCEKDWNPADQIQKIEARIQAIAGNRNVVFFVSGGVDSTVAYTLCLRVLGAERVYGIYVDTGFMREGETAFVEGVFRDLGATAFHVESAGKQFVNALLGLHDPEEKRHAIGDQFVQVQERILETGHFLDGHWILGQGTIYPDTIESGGSLKADIIKTHHNRVAGIQRLIEANRIVEPLSLFYKDEVREIGRELGLPAELLNRHPFPGPGLAIRCLCARQNASLQETEEGWIVPIKSVGVQGDSRSYRPVLALDDFPSPAANLQERATNLINRLAGINRVIARVSARVPLNRMQVSEASLTAERLALLRQADAIIRKRSADSGFDRKIWQFPVVLIPLGTEAHPDSIVLRPIESVDGMTAQSVIMESDFLQSIAEELQAIPGICGVFYDLTHKPPATIEWE